MFWKLNVQNKLVVIYRYRTRQSELRAGFDFRQNGPEQKYRTINFYIIA